MKYCGILGNSMVDYTFNRPNLRQLILLFDNLNMFHLEDSLKNFREGNKVADLFDKNFQKSISQYCNEIEYLAKHDYVTDLPYKSLDLPASDDSEKLLNQIFNLDTDINKQLNKIAIKDFQVSNVADIFINSIAKNACSDRLSALAISNKYKEIKAVPIISNSLLLPKDKTVSKMDMLYLTLTHLPNIDESIPLESILEFKKDAEAQLKFKKLMIWYNELAKSTITRNEFEEYIEYLLMEYEDSLKLHKLKYTYSTLETILTTTSSIIENVAKLKLTQATASLFNFKRQSINALQEEKSLKGGEVAFILMANQKFN